MLVGMLVLLIVAEVMTAFTIVSTVSDIDDLHMVDHSRVLLRLSKKRLSFTQNQPMPGGVTIGELSLAFIGFVLCLQALRTDTRVVRPCGVVVKYRLTDTTQSQTLLSVHVLSRSIFKSTNALHARLLYRRSGYLQFKVKSICAQRPCTPNSCASCPLQSPALYPSTHWISPIDAV